MAAIRISDESAPFTVVTRVSLSEGQQAQYRSLQERLMRVFAQQPGFVGVAVLVSDDGEDALTYLQWKSRDAHEACMASPDFAPYNPEWMELLSSGGEFSFNSYEVLAVHSGIENR